MAHLTVRGTEQNLRTKQDLHPLLLSLFALLPRRKDVFLPGADQHKLKSYR